MEESTTPLSADGSGWTAEDYKRHAQQECRRRLGFDPSAGNLTRAQFLAVLDLTLDVLKNELQPALERVFGRDGRPPAHLLH